MSEPSLTPNVIVAMLGARQNYAAARLLHREGRLAALVTDFYSGSVATRTLLAIASQVPGLRKAMAGAAGRYHVDLGGARILSSKSLGVSVFLRRRKALDRADLQNIKHSAARDLAERYATLELPPGETVIAYAGAALEVFEVAKARGARRILDQSIAAYPVIQRLLAAEVAVHGSWVTRKGLPELEGSEFPRLRAEWAAADIILCASEFVRQSMVESGVPAKKCRLVPYGVSLANWCPRASDYDGKRPLRLLFAGHVGLRKGVPYLLEALARLEHGQVELQLAGDVELRPEVTAAQPAHIRFLGRVPRAQMEELYRWADLFVLPSIIEGSAVVVYEALSFGLPVITTLNAGSVVEDDLEGRIIPAADTDALACAIASYIAKPELLAAHAAAARAASGKVDLRRYERDLFAVLREARDPHGQITDTTRSS